MVSTCILVPSALGANLTLNEDGRDSAFSGTGWSPGKFLGLITRVLVPGDS